MSLLALVFANEDLSDVRCCGSKDECLLLTWAWYQNLLRAMAGTFRVSEICCRNVNVVQ